MHFRVNNFRKKNIRKDTMHKLQHKWQRQLQKVHLGSQGNTKYDGKAKTLQELLKRDIQRSTGMSKNDWMAKINAH